MIDLGKVSVVNLGKEVSVIDLGKDASVVNLGKEVSMIDLQQPPPLWLKVANMGRQQSAGALNTVEGRTMETAKWLMCS